MNAVLHSFLRRFVLGFFFMTSSFTANHGLNTYDMFVLSLRFFVLTGYFSSARNVHLARNQWLILGM